MSVIATSLPAEPLEALRYLALSESELDRIRREQVAAARAGGASWQQIGDALGMTRQSAWGAFTETARAAISSNTESNATLGEDEAMDIAVEEVRAVRRQRRA